MIRPFTIICCALAAGAVLYTYQSKHAVQLLDRQIEKTLTDTAALREQSRALKAEWTLRENPERLRTFVDQYLNLKPVLPSQFTTMAELDARLPAPRVMAPDTGTTDMTEDPADTPIASGQPNAEITQDTALAADDLPIPPLPVPPPVAVAAVPASPPVPAGSPASVPAGGSVIAERKPAVPRPLPARPPVVTAGTPVPAQPIQLQPVQAQAGRSVAVQTSPVQASPGPAPPIQARLAQAPPMQVAPAQTPAVQARPQFAPAPTPVSQPVQSGSLLGMAHSGALVPVPVPRPMPVSTTQWTNGN